MIKKEANHTRSIRRVNLTLPIIQTHSYEIYRANPFGQTQSTAASNEYSVLHGKSLNNKSSNNQRTRIQLPSQLPCLTDSLMTNLYVNTPFISIQSSSIADTISNALIKSDYSEQTLNNVTGVLNRNKYQQNKDVIQQSQMSIGDKFWFDSTKHDIHQPPLTKVKVLHQRKTCKNSFCSNDIYLRVPNTTSLGDFAEDTNVSPNKRLQQRIEKLTKNYFPMIQQLRHGHPCPELISNRMHLHREEKRDFVP
ncbi:hypothetical protein I4U23_008252 [Adineta vaga]|nr:hypothetical protein I4U23_008252 [Adineta vaga]